MCSSDLTVDIKTVVVSTILNREYHLCYYSYLKTMFDLQVSFNKLECSLPSRNAHTVGWNMFHLKHNCHDHDSLIAKAC